MKDATKHALAALPQQQPQQPSAAAEFKAIGREAIKDIRGTMMEFFFDKGEKPGEPGTPYNPTMQIVTEDLKGVHVDMKTDQLARRPEMDMDR